jgi:glycosyltransferase involved in cell wall biosynthesis
MTDPELVRSLVCEPSDAEIVAPGTELPGLTGIVPALNEEQNLEACLASFAEICDELIVVDSFSNDRTVEIASRFTKRIYQRKWKDYRTFMHFAVPRARHRWILIVDCDERITPGLRNEIRERVDRDGDGFDGFRIMRVNHFLGRRIRHSGWTGDYIYRFYRKGKGGPREQEVHPGMVIRGEVAALDGVMLHFPYPTLEDYFTKFNRYTSGAARDRLARGRRATWLDVLFRPPFRFFSHYVLRLGFLDGFQGFLLACFGGFYVFARYAKMWQMQNQEAIEASNQAFSVGVQGGGAKAPLRLKRRVAKDEHAGPRADQATGPSAVGMA